MADQEAFAQARAALRRGSKSFHGAARLFDPATRRSVVLLYAWCRHCDDVIDEQHLGFAAPAAPAPDIATRLAGLRANTILACTPGALPAEPVFAGLAEVVARHHLPPRYPLAHLDGFAMDAAGRRYRTEADILDYCWHVAGVIGVMMALIMGARDDETLDRASDLGIAFQLTNIARDVIDDARAGRVYLPTDWLDAEGIDPAGIAGLAERARLAAVTARLIDLAEPYYASAAIGLRALPARSAWSIATALRVYRAIGRKVRARGAAAWDRRVVTSKPEKLCHLLAASLPATVAATRGPGQRRPPRDALWTRPA